MTGVLSSKGEYSTYYFEGQSDRVQRCVVACFQPLFHPGLFTYQLESNAPVYRLSCGKWGELGFLTFTIENNRKVSLRFDPPGLPSDDDVERLADSLWEETRTFTGRLAMLNGETDRFIKSLAPELREMRIHRRQELEEWLLRGLKIFGFRAPQQRYEEQDQGSEGSTRFDFLVKGAPSQFVAVFRIWAVSLKEQPEYEKLNHKVRSEDGNWDRWPVPADADQVEVKLALGKVQLNITAHSLPEPSTLLRVIVANEETGWKIWNLLRDELERLGFFTLPEIPIIKSQPVAVPTPVSPPESKEVWNIIPSGPDREIVRLWHKGLSSKEIGVQVRFAEKTVLNHLHSLRDQYGDTVVPYRKTRPKRRE